jgi:hypothetical protein
LEYASPVSFLEKPSTRSSEAACSPLNSHGPLTSHSHGGQEAKIRTSAPFFYRNICVEVLGTGRYRIISRGQEMLLRFLTSARGPQGRLTDPSCCPWRPSGNFLLETSRAKVIAMENMRATSRLISSGREYAGLAPVREERSHWQVKSGILDVGSLFEEMAEKSGAAARAALEWLGDIRGPGGWGRYPSAARFTTTDPDGRGREDSHVAGDSDIFIFHRY